MGWLIGWHSRSALIQHLCENNGVKTIKRFFSGNNMWTVQESKDGVRFICLYKIIGGRGQDWGYKDIDESMGPYEETCPLSFFALAPAMDIAWRERCKAAHERTYMKLENGDYVVLTNGRTYRVVSSRPLKGVDVLTGMYYRIPRRMLSSKNPTPHSILREAAGNSETMDIHRQIVRIAHYLGNTQLERRPIVPEVVNV